jgi:hypothetical protein
MITTPAEKLASLEVRRNWDSKNFGMKVDVPATANPSAVPAIVVNRNTLFLKSDLRAGRNSLALCGFCSSAIRSWARLF